MKTKVKPGSTDVVNLALQMQRHPETLAAFGQAMKAAERKKAVGARIKEQRERLGLTQEQVTERAGLGTGANSVRKYQHWERGSHLPGAETLEAVAEALKTSYDYLVTGGEQAPPVEDIIERLDRIEAAVSSDATDRPQLLEGLGRLIAVQDEMSGKLDELLDAQARKQKPKASSS